MSTAKLLWGCLKRATGYGVALGAGLGALYGAFAVPLIYALTALIELGPGYLLPAVPGVLESMLYGTPVGLLAGGLVFGPLMGFLLGPLNGLFLFVLLKAVRLPLPPRDQEGRPLPNRCAVAWGASAATTAVAVLLVGWYLWNTDPSLFSVSGWRLRETPDSYGPRSIDIAYTITIVVGPAILALLAMRWADGEVVDWYMRESREAGQHGDQREALVDGEHPAQE